VKDVRVCGTDRYGKNYPCVSTHFYSVLVKVVRVCGTDRYGKVGLVAVRIGTACW
jgi:hypothetical protein